MKRLVQPKFPDPIKLRCLLWCDRHCCLCKKSCGTDIELAHINERAAPVVINSADNAIPLCYDCHARIGHYNVEHPRGNRYKAKELKSRREQVYDEFTRHLVPLIDFRVTQTTLSGGIRTFPDIGFQVSHREKVLPVEVFTELSVRIDAKKAFIPGGHYAKAQPWRMNPGFTIQGHFVIPETALKGAKRVSAVLRAYVRDQYGRDHGLLPIEWVYEIGSAGDWWCNP